MSRYIVLGAGITGMTAARQLSLLGAEVTVIEKSSIVGGHVASYCCKATDSCSRCGVCVAHTQLSTSLADPHIKVLTGSEVDAVAFADSAVKVQIRQRQPSVDYKKCVHCDACIEACPENCIEKYSRGEFVQYEIEYSRCLLHNGENCTACRDACGFEAIAADNREQRRSVSGSAALIATGHLPFEATKKARYGYGRHRNVMTGLEAEQALSNSLNFGNPAERVAFVQCVGSRDPVIGRNFCSGVCCAYALRLARILKYRNPDMEVTIYYIDLQNFDKEFTALKNEIVDLGVNLVRGLPFRVDGLPEGTLSLPVETAEGETEAAVYDRVVLSVGIDHRSDAANVAEAFGLTRDEFGFYASNSNAVYIGGTCKEPMSMPESMAAAKAAAAEMWSKA